MRPSFAAPNIVLIMADDMGWSDTSNDRTNMGNASDYYETPMLARLAREGMSFTNAYTNGASCAPTRAALLTGQYAARPTNNLFAVESLNKVPDSYLVGPSQGLPTGTDAIPTNSFTYAEMLQSQGYVTAHIGKFHVTEVGPAGAALIQSDHGFDYNYGGTQLGNPGQYHAADATFVSHIGPELDAFAGDYTQQYVDENIKPYANGTSIAAIDALVGTDKHVSDAMADAAIQFLEQAKGNRFLLQFHPYAVHTPVGDAQARADLLDKYRNKTRGKADKNAPFGALLEGMDQNVARIIDYLESTADPDQPDQMLKDNTLVLFLSDNGGRQPQSNNGPLKGEKGALDEGGIRVPMIAWSGNSQLVDRGTINSTPVATIDFYRTFVGLSGAEEPEGVTLDGVNLSAILADSNAELGREELFWHYPGYNKHRTQQPQSVVRKGDWKLLYNYEDQSFELYNLAEDLSELNDLAASKTEKVAELGAILMNWLDEVDAPLAMLRNGQKVLNVSGAIYSNGRITNHEGRLTIRAGEEMPFVLRNLLDLAERNIDSNAKVEQGRHPVADLAISAAMQSDSNAVRPKSAHGALDMDVRHIRPSSAEQDKLTSNHALQ